jgi:carbon-monoxide dehydrogenase large subunit
MGEGGAIASPPALANAINDALAPLGIHLTRQPMSPSAIVSALLGQPRPSLRCPCRRRRASSAAH